MANENKRSTPGQIFYARSIAGMTQDEAARTVHVEHNDAGRVWRRWENGERQPLEAVVHLFCLLTGQQYPLPDASEITRSSAADG